MRLASLFLTATFCVLAVGPVQSDTAEALAREVRAAETAFAKTMADRDLPAFVSFVADDAVFFGSVGALRGIEAVKKAWSPLFQGPVAPFSWKPEVVEVLDSGDLAFSSGPVLDPQGNRIGTFNSVWRREAKGSWQVIFDKGCPPCGSPPKAPQEAASP